MNGISKTSKQYIFEDTINIKPGERSSISMDDFQKKDSKYISVLTSRENIVFENGKKIKKIIFSRNDIATENLSNPKFRELFHAQQATTKNRIEDLFRKKNINSNLDLVLNDIKTNYKFSRSFNRDENTEIKESLENMEILNNQLSPLEFDRNNLNAQMNNLWIEARTLDSEGNTDKANLKKEEANQHKRKVAELNTMINNLGDRINVYEKKIEQIRNGTNSFVPYLNANKFIDVMIKEKKLITAYNPLNTAHPETSTEKKISSGKHNTHDKNSEADSKNINSLNFLSKSENIEKSSSKNLQDNSRKLKPLPKRPK